jgi:hypothetical protein
MSAGLTLFFVARQIEAGQVASILCPPIPQAQIFTHIVPFWSPSLVQESSSAPPSNVCMTLRTSRSPLIIAPAALPCRLVVVVSWSRTKRSRDTRLFVGRSENVAEATSSL